MIDFSRLLMLHILSAEILDYVPGGSLVAKIRFSIVLFLFILFLVTGRESHAVIYKYTNDKDVPVYADDMQKIPEQYRAQAVIVSGVAVDEQADAERARKEAEELARQEQDVLQEQADELFGTRLVRSGIAVGLFAVILFVTANLDVLKTHAQVLFRIRTALVVLLVASLGFIHARDLKDLFTMAGGPVSSPVADIRERSAQRGRKAAEAFKSMDQVLEQKTAEEEERLRQIDRKFEEAERGK